MAWIHSDYNKRSFTNEEVSKSDKKYQKKQMFSCFFLAMWYAIVYNLKISVGKNGETA